MGAVIVHTSTKTTAMERWGAASLIDQNCSDASLLGLKIHVCCVAFSTITLGRLKFQEEVISSNTNYNTGNSFLIL